MLRLNDLLKEHRARTEAAPKVIGGPMTFAAAAETVLRRVGADPSLKPSAKAYRRRCLEALLRSWPNLALSDVRKITGRQCQEWASVFAQRYAPSVYNNTVKRARLICGPHWIGLWKSRRFHPRDRL